MSATFPEECTWKYGVRRDGSVWMSIEGQFRHCQFDFGGTPEDARLACASPAMLAALEAQVEADRLSGIYQTYAEAPTSWEAPDYDSRCDEMHAAWMQAQDLAEKLRAAALSAARGDGKGEA